MGVALVSDLSDLSDLSDKMGAPLYTPRACCTAVWFGSGENLPQRYAVTTAARLEESAAVPTGKFVRDF